MRWAALTGVVTACLMVTVGSSASTPGPRYLVSAARLPGYSGIVELLGPKGGVQRVLSRNSGGWPAASWSPNGTMVAWVDRQGLKIAHADGSGVRLLVRASRTCSTICVPMTFAWSPTGRQLLVGGATGRLRRITTVHPLIVPPAWSPDSRRLAVIGAQVLTLDPTGHNLRRLGTTHGALVVWTRSGKLFVVRGEHDNQVFVSRDG